MTLRVGRSQATSRRGQPHPIAHHEIPILQAFTKPVALPIEAAMGTHLPGHTRPPSTDRLERPVVRIIVAITLLIAAVTLCLALISRESAFFIHAAASALTGLLGLIQIALKREHTYSLVMISAFAIVINVTITGTVITLASSVVGLVVIGIGATLFSTSPRAHIATYSVFLAIAMWVWHDGAMAAGLFEGVTTATVFAFGAGLINWIRSQADVSAAGYEHLFRRAPISLWREDFTQVHDWLVWLRSTGVTDLAAYLDADPKRVAETASLIEVTEVNEAAVRLLEAESPDDLRGRLDPNGMTEASRASLRDQLLGIWDGKSEIVTEIRNGRTVRGNRLEGLLSFSIPRIDGKPDYSQVVVAIVDVTESRLARSALEDLVASKDELVAAVSHELRTPLTAVVGLAGEIEEFIRLIAAQSEDVSLIVEDLLVAAQAETGSIHVRPEPTNIPDQIAMAIEGFRTEHDIPVEMPRPIGRAHVDPARVRQIIRNLVTNAHRYGSDPIRVVVDAAEDHVIVEVRDAGAPLALEQRSEIFNRYHRAKERPGVAASLGVGLTVSRELARAMGGDLTYDYDGETVFTLTLPKWTGDAALAG